jgi:PAS domain S-box-containing protein
MTKEKILVVEDEGLVAMSLKKSLEDLGYEVPATAAAADEAIKKIAKESPDLILMDIRLKGDIDGIEAANQIRKTSQVPIVYLTAHSDEKTLSRAKQSEPFGYIVKPYEVKSLHSTIEMALQKAAAQSEVTQKKNKLASILRCISEGVLVFDLKGAIDYINPAGREFVGYTSTKDRIYGGIAEIAKFRTLHEEEAVDLPLDKVISDAAPITIENLWLDRKDTSVPVDITVGPVSSERGVVNGIVLTIRDITIRLKMNGFV